MTYQQFKNLRELPNIEKCEIIKKGQKNIEEYKNEMQLALDLAVKNNTTHIRKLSELVS